MSVEQYQRTVNTLDKEITDLEKKKNALDSKCADLNKKIGDAEAAIRKTKSASTVKSKLNQISTWQKEESRKASESANIGKKISEKRTKRNDAYKKMQKAQRDEEKKKDKRMKSMQVSNENRVKELTNQLSVKPLIPETIHTYVESNEEYDVFVSHAWEDKEGFVDEFVAELEKLDIKVW